MDETNVGLMLMIAAVMIIGVTFGFYAHKHNDASYGLTFGTDGTSYGGDTAKAVALYAITLFMYSVGVIAHQPAEMTYRLYSPVAYAVLVLFCFVVGILIAMLISWVFFSSLKKLAEWYLKISNC